jgi:hypothetical protein
MSQAEHPDRLVPTHRVTVDDVRQVIGASTPHFALQIRERLRRLVAGLDAEDPARTMAEQEIARLDELAHTGEVRGEPDDTAMRTLPSVSAAAADATPGGHGHH